MPIFIDPNNPWNLVNAGISAVIAFGACFALTWFFGLPRELRTKAGAKAGDEPDLVTAGNARDEA